MSQVTQPPPSRPRPRRSGELGVRELLRWTWRQVCSMRTALVLLLLLALAAVPGSVIPQSGVDALNTTRWKEQHPTLAPIYEKLGLFSVYDSAWFSAIYLLLMLSLVGCIVPRLFVYARNLRAVPPPAPRNLTRMPAHVTYETDDDVDAVLAQARAVLRKRRYRLRPVTEGEGADGADRADRAVSSERGYLREAGNLIFHLSVLVVLAGFAVGGLFGYQGGVVLVQGKTFANVATQYDDFDPGTFFGPEDLNPFSFTLDQFSAEWIQSKTSRTVTARKFNAAISYGAGTDRDSEYDLRVNHPLDIGGTDLFLIGHGYAPEITVRDGDGNIAASGPTVFLPQDQTFVSFGVVKAPTAAPTQIGLEGLFFPNDDPADGEPLSYYPDAFVGVEGLTPLLSLTVYTGDLGFDSGLPQSVYSLDTAGAQQLKKADGTAYRLDLRPGETKELPNGLGSVSFDGIKPWVRVQISQTPGKEVALIGVVMALVGLLGSLFIRPRRVWVRARREGGVTMVEVAGLDRSGGGDVDAVLARIVADLRGDPDPPGGAVPPGTEHGPQHRPDRTTEETT